WILRFSNGYTKRANAIYPLSDSGHDLEGKIKTCENLYKSKKLKPIFKITPYSRPQTLDARLEQKGYTAQGKTHMQTLCLDTINESAPHTMQINSILNDTWLEHFYQMAKVDEKHHATMKKML